MLPALVTNEAVGAMAVSGQTAPRLAHPFHEGQAGDATGSGEQRSARESAQEPSPTAHKQLPWPSAGIGRVACLRQTGETKMCGQGRHAAIHGPAIPRGISGCSRRPAHKIEMPVARAQWFSRRPWKTERSLQTRQQWRRDARVRSSSNPGLLDASIGCECAKTVSCLF